MKYFEKTAANLKTLKKVQKVINPRLIKGRELVDWLPGELSLKRGIGTTGISSSAPANYKKFKGKIIIGEGGPIKRLEDYENFRKRQVTFFTEKLTSSSSVVKGLEKQKLPNIPKSPKQKEMINRIVGHHEFSEATVKKKNYRPFSSHGSIDVLSRESNLLASLPKSYKPTVDFFSKMRTITGETAEIRKHIPKFEYGKTHLSPAAKKHILKKTAAGPVIVYKKPPFGEWGGYLPSGKNISAKNKKILKKYKATKKGLIMVNPEPFKSEKKLMRKDYKDYSPAEFKEMYKQQNRDRAAMTKKHELVHYIRDRKGKLSSKYYGMIPGAKLIEETAAYGRVEGSKWKGFREALEAKYPKLQKILKKIIKTAGLVEEYKASPKGLLYIAPTGSGKTKKILEATRKNKTVAITPASITKNLAKEEMKFFKKVTPRKSFTYAKLSRGHDLPESKHLVLDESHAIRNPKTKTFQNIAMQRWKFDKALLATATPMYNEPYDIVSQVNLVANRKVLPMNKAKFYKKYYTEVKTDPGIIGRMLGIKGAKERVLRDPDKVRALLDKHTYVVSKSKVKDLMPGKAEEIVKVPMSKKQHELYKYVSKKLPFYLRYKIRKNLPPTKSEAKKLNAYLMGVRQISNTTRGFVKEANSSPKFERMVEDARAELATGGKVLMYSNFRRSGVDALSERFKKLKVPHGMIVGSTSKKQRADEVTRYQKGLNKLLLYSGAGSEGLNLPKTTLVQITEPYWNISRTQQAAARGIRRGDDPSRTVKVKKYLSVFPKETNILGIPKKKGSSVDEYLLSMSKRKNKEIKQLLEAIKDE